MKTYLITFRSITYAQRAKGLFDKAAWRCRMRRPMRWMEEKGCGHGVEVRLGDLTPALRLLRQSGIPWGRTWLVYPEGEVEELRYDLS